MSLTTVQSTKASGQKMDCDVAEAFKFGKMALNMKVIGKMIWRTDADA